MKSCEEYGELISACIDGELEAGDASAVEKHLAECGDCRAMYEEFRANDAAARDLPTPDESSWGCVWFAIQRGLASAERSRQRILTGAVRGAMLTAAAAAILLVAYVLTPGTAPVAPISYPAGFEVVSLEVASADYTPVVMVSDHGDIPVIWIEKT